MAWSTGGGRRPGGFRPQTATDSPADRSGSHRDGGHGHGRNGVKPAADSGEIWKRVKEHVPAGAGPGCVLRLDTVF